MLKLALMLCLASHALAILHPTSSPGRDASFRHQPTRSLSEGRRAIMAAAVLTAVTAPALALDVMDPKTRSLMKAVEGQREATVDSSPLIEELKRRSVENKAKNEALVRQQTQVSECTVLLSYPNAICMVLPRSSEAPTLSLHESLCREGSWL